MRIGLAIENIHCAVPPKSNQSHTKEIITMSEQLTRRSILKATPLIALPVITGAAIASERAIEPDRPSPIERAEYHAEKLTSALKEQMGGKWRCEIKAQMGFVLIVQDSKDS